ncbi:hypothetical protein [Hymenobacter sp. GOD-10R]|uniref:hypothetical protein n=1 Tax=Hymenobacter sp. GOD-10R TaxID=3093922 RepID=UPI002D778AF0|nr:hypothetical protein [Hymenobacter sp. GOD-10R]WRQ26691.1 hypothetical protein SD425_16585 [Hymenobacter sp. GOD-10R]
MATNPHPGAYGIVQHAEVGTRCIAQPSPAISPAFIEEFKQLCAKHGLREHSTRNFTNQLQDAQK